MTSEPIEPADVLAHPEDYLLDGEPVVGVRLEVDGYDVRTFSDSTMADTNRECPYNGDWVGPIFEIPVEVPR